MTRLKKKRGTLQHRQQYRHPQIPVSPKNYWLLLHSPLQSPPGTFLWTSCPTSRRAQSTSSSRTSVMTKPRRKLRYRKGPLQRRRTPCSRFPPQTGRAWKLRPSRPVSRRTAGPPYRRNYMLFGASILLQRGNRAAPAPQPKTFGITRSLKGESARRISRSLRLAWRLKNEQKAVSARLRTMYSLPPTFRSARPAALSLQTG